MHIPKVIIHRLDPPLHRVMAEQQLRRKKQLRIAIVGILILAGGTLLRRPAVQASGYAAFAQSSPR